MLAMHQNSFSVLWTLLLFMVGQGMLEIVVFIMMLFFTILILNQVETKTKNTLKTDIEYALVK